MDNEIRITNKDELERFKQWAEEVKWHITLENEYTIIYILPVHGDRFDVIKTKYDYGGD